MNVCLPEEVELEELNVNSILLNEVKELLQEYGNYMYNGLGLIAGKERFFKELEMFPGNIYSQPSGVFIIAKCGATLIGCVGIKKLDAYTCEMKRLFVRPAYRRRGTGLLICDFLVQYSRKLKYKSILLDTNLEMKEAVELYKKYGFKEIKAYCINENQNAVFMQYIL